LFKLFRSIDLTKGFLTVYGHPHFHSKIRWQKNFWGWKRPQSAVTVILERAQLTVKKFYAPMPPLSTWSPARTTVTILVEFLKPSWKTLSQQLEKSWRALLLKKSYVRPWIWLILWCQMTMNEIISKLWFSVNKSNLFWTPKSNDRVETELIVVRNMVLELWLELLKKSYIQWASAKVLRNARI
jgi:hypothetical protein